MPGPVIPLVTTLPAKAVVGDVVAYDTSFGPVWTFMYLPDGGSYPWRFIGGAPKYSSIGTSEAQTATGVWGDVATVGPTITVPFAGNYAALAVVTAFNNFAGANRAFMGIALGAGTPTEFASEDVDAQAHYRSLTSQLILGALTASQELRVRYLSGANGHAFLYRTLTVWPLRCS